MTKTNAAWLRAAAALILALVAVTAVLLREHKRADQKSAAVPSSAAPAAEASQAGAPTSWVELGSAPETDAAKIQKALAAASIDTRAGDASPGVRTLSVPTRDAARARTLANEESVLQGLSFTPPAEADGPAR